MGLLGKSVLGALLMCWTGCSHPEHGAEVHTEGAAHEHGAVSVTLWAEKTELFMEHPPLVVGQEAAFLVHLTDRKDFKAVSQGRLGAVFQSQEGHQVRVVAEAPVRPGIFRLETRFAQPGTYELELRLEGPQVEDLLRVAPVLVYPDLAAVPHEEEEAAGEEISFLKEQQWRIDFRMEPAQTRLLAASVQAVGEILPRVQAHAEVPALVSGIILADQNARVPALGAWVRKGEVLAVISPPAETESSLLRLRNDYLLAEAEFERAQRLFAKQAVPKKRLDEARLRYEAQKASYAPIAQQVDFATTAEGGMGLALHFHVKAPIDGVVEEAHFHLGQTVQAGQKLFAITNPERVWLKAQVPLSRLSQLGQVTDAAFRVEGHDREFRVSQLGGRLISVGSIADRESRTIPVIFELDNPDNLLKINLFAEVAIHTGEQVEALSVPTSALFDDSGTPVVYVQLGGESFAKRAVKTGAVDQGFTQILDGITAGEYVVSTGGYQVRLASLSAAVPSGHGHAH